MGCNKLLISSSILFCQSLLVLINIPIAFSIDNFTELKHNCSVGSNRSYETNSSYSQSLLYLVDNLRGNAPTHNGFWNAASQDPNNTAYGLALCRGDLSPNECEMCLINVTNMVVDKYCPNSRGAIILNDYCMLKYSDNIDFRGQIDSKIYYFNLDDTVEIQNLTNVAVELLSNLSQTAITRPGNKFFADGAKNIYEDYWKLYGMVQCTGDLNVTSCGQCLNDSISYISTWVTMDEEGAQVYKGSCRVKYETSSLKN